MQLDCRMMLWIVIGCQCACQAPRVLGEHTPLGSGTFAKGRLTFTGMIFDRVREYQVTEGSARGSRWRMVRVDLPDGTWRCKVEHQFEHHYRKRNSTTLEILEEVDFPQSARVVYAPALQLTAEDSPGWVQSSMTVWTLNGKAVRDRGTCRYKVKILGSQRMLLKDGPITMIVLRMTRELKLGLARGQVIVYYAFSPGLGLVAQRTVQNLTTFGVIPLRSREAFGMVGGHTLSGDQP